MNEKIKNFLVGEKISIKETMRIIDYAGIGTAFVVAQNNEILGVVTDGDIRRAILNGVSIEKPIEGIMNKNLLAIQGTVSEKEIYDYLAKNNKEIRERIAPGTASLKIPVLGANNEIQDIVFVYPNGQGNLKTSRLGQEKNILENGNAGVKKVLVIGGAGYLGSVLCRRLLEKGYKVRAYDNLTYGQDGIKELLNNSNFEFFEGDIRDISSIVQAIKGVDAVIHLGAIVGDPACAQEPGKTLEINYLATKMIVETCKYFQINRFIFASTCSVYGQSSSSDEQLTEESKLNPLSLYAETKIKCEQSILSAIDDNFSPTILRMATLYGYSPNMRFDLAFNLLTAKAFFEKEIMIFGGDQWRPWLHLEDAAKVYIKCLESPLKKIKGGIFNVVSENHKVIDIGRTINSFFPEAKLNINQRDSDKRNYNVSFAKISNVLRFKPEKKITDGVVEIKSAIENGLVSDYKNPNYRFSLPQI